MTKLILKSAANSFFVNGTEFQKGTLSIDHNDSGISIRGVYSAFENITCDGNSVSSKSDLSDWISENCFRSGGGSVSEGAVNSVTGNMVSGTSTNPVVSLSGEPRDIVTFDDDGNPEVKPIGITQLTDVGSFPSFANGVFVATAMNSESKTGFLLFVEFSTDTPKAGTFPTYNTGGRLPVGDAVNPGDAVNLGQINSLTTVIPAQPQSGNYLLMSIGGVLEWVPG